MEEIWKDINGYEGSYQVSNMGRIRSLDKVVQCRFGKTAVKKGKILRQRKNVGYLYICLSNKGVHKVYRVHILVAKAFVDNQESKPQVNHKNGNKTDNRAENLEWVSAKDNLMHAWKNNLNKRGEPKEIYQYDKNGKLVNKYESAKEASRKTGIDHANICRCASKESYHTAGGYIWKWGKKLSEQKE